MRHRFIETERMLVQRLVLGPLENNCFILRCRATNASVIIDAAAEPAAIERTLAGSSPTAIVTTHGHADHVGAAKQVSEHVGIPILMHEADSALTGWAPDAGLDHGQKIRVGELEIDVLHTPGHTPGSVCLAVEHQLFTGDTLFPGGPGATRFPYSDFDQIMESVETELFSWPDATPFHPGHGASSTIGDERPELEIWRRRRW